MKTNCFIGVTGGIGSGKSSVSRFWSAYGNLPLVDIDQLCRELLEVEMPGWVALKEKLGDSYFRQDGTLDRQALRSAIFDNESMRRKVDQLIHPMALDLLHSRTASLHGSVLVDVPLIFEAGWEKHFCRTVVVYADQQICCRRLSRRDKLLPEEAAKAIHSQMPIGEKAMLADHVIDNRYCWLLTRVQVSHLAGLIEDYL